MSIKPHYLTPGGEKREQAWRLERRRRDQELSRPTREWVERQRNDEKAAWRAKRGLPDDAPIYRTSWGYSTRPDGPARKSTLNRQSDAMQSFLERQAERRRKALSGSGLRRRTRRKTSNQGSYHPRKVKALM